MKPSRIIKGFRPLHFLPDGILFSQGYSIYIADFECKHFRFLCNIPHSIVRGFASHLRPLARLLRTGISLAARISGDGYLLADRTYIWHLNVKDGSFHFEHRAKRAKPLNLVPITALPGFLDGIYYGEYGFNPTKDPMAIWHRSGSGCWNRIYTFPKGAINHIHSIIPDYFRNQAWILTGDFEGGAALWLASGGFLKVEPFLRGRQDFRSVILFPLEGGAIYATDSQTDSNSIMRIGFASAEPTAVAPLNGSCIYGCKVNGALVFSTAVEPGLPSGSYLRDFMDRTPGPAIHSRNATIVMETAPNLFTTLDKIPKDWMPYRPFQFGSLCFPEGENLSGKLYAYATALSGVDDCTLIYDFPRSL